MTIEARLRYAMMHIAEPITRAIGKTHAPFTHKQVKAIHYRVAHQLLEPGMVILSRTRGEATNLVIPGYWSHSAIYAGGDSVIEAIGKGVVETDLIDFMLSKDHVAIYTPIFADGPEMLAASRWATGQKGKAYDYELTMDKNSFYCSKLCFFAYDLTMASSPWKLRETWGVPTVTPNDYSQATDKWREIFNSAAV